LRQDRCGWRAVLRGDQPLLAWLSPESVFATSLCQSVGRYPPPDGIWDLGSNSQAGASGDGFGSTGATVALLGRVRSTPSPPLHVFRTTFFRTCARAAPAT
jgi:hypothetical protein